MNMKIVDKKMKQNNHIYLLHNHVSYMCIYNVIAWMSNKEWIIYQQTKSFDLHEQKAIINIFNQLLVYHWTNLKYQMLEKVNKRIIKNNSYIKCFLHVFNEKRRNAIYSI